MWNSREQEEGRNARQKQIKEQESETYQHNVLGSKETWAVVRKELKGRRNQETRMNGMINKGLKKS